MDFMNEYTISFFFAYSDADFEDLRCEKNILTIILFRCYIDSERLRLY